MNSSMVNIIGKLLLTYNLKCDIMWTNPNMRRLVRDIIRCKYYWSSCWKNLYE